jgi:hypothetical protein
MAVSTDILRTWRGPRAVMRDLLGRGAREDRALAYVMGACFLMFLAQLPLLARLVTLSVEAAELDPARPALDQSQLFGTAFVAWMMIAPLALYGVAWVAYLILRALRLRVTGYGVRLALFWSFLAATPLALLLGLLQGLNGPGPGTQLVGGLWILTFAWFWVQTTRETLADQGAGA